MNRFDVNHVPPEIAQSIDGFSQTCKCGEMLKIKLIEPITFVRMSVKSHHGCGKKLASGQWWGFCGETDMGQTYSALCEECGGEFKLAE